MTPEAAEKYGLELTLTPLHRSSFLPAQRSWTRGLANADFYFCEVQAQDAAKYTLSGPFVEEGEVLVEACRTDWRRWNKRAEEMKTASLLRSE
jgi:beta-galactosidase